MEFLKKMPASIPEAERARLRTQATDAYNNDFLPAWRKLLAYMETTYAVHVRPSIGISSLANGREDYAILIRRLTTTNATPEEIHKTGLAEVDRIEAEMLAIARQTGFQGSVSELEVKLANDPEQRFRSKDEMLMYCRNAAKIIEPQLPNQFKHIPMLLYGIRAIPEDREQAVRVAELGHLDGGVVDGRDVLELDDLAIRLVDHVLGSLGPEVLGAVLALVHRARRFARGRERMVEGLHCGPAGRREEHETVAGAPLEDLDRIAVPREAAPARADDAQTNAIIGA